MGARQYDLTILGGGPAGSPAALVAGRARLRTAIINEERPRNRVTKAGHGFFTRDGAHALELLQRGKSDLQQYATVEHIIDEAIHVARDDDGFLIQRADVRRMYVVGDAHAGFARRLASANEGAHCAETIVEEAAMEAWR